MSVRISVLGQVASINNGVWACDDAAVLSRIIQVSPGYLPDTEQAREVARELGGKAMDSTTAESADFVVEVDEEGRPLIH